MFSCLHCGNKLLWVKEDEPIVAKFYSLCGLFLTKALQIHNISDLTIPLV